MLRMYRDEYFNDICEITRKCWHGELLLNERSEKIIYTLLSKYSFSNSQLSRVDYSDKVDAFVFAGFKRDHVDITEWLNETIKDLNDSDKNTISEYFNYLEFNHSKVFSHMKDGDIYLSLIASTKRNSGTLLLDFVKKTACDNNSRIFLWTDETCNYKYYETKGFKLVEKYYTTLLDKKIQTYIYKFEIK